MSERELANQIFKILDSLGYEDASHTCRNFASSFKHPFSQNIEQALYKFPLLRGEAKEQAYRVIDTLINPQLFAQAPIPATKEKLYTDLVEIILSFVDFCFKQGENIELNFLHILLKKNREFNAYLSSLFNLEQPEANTFAYVQELPLKTQRQSYNRVDCGLYINGILIGLVEFKDKAYDLSKAVDQLHNHQYNATDLTTPYTLFSQLLVAIAGDSMAYSSVGEAVVTETKLKPIKFKPWQFDPSVKDFINHKVATQINAFWQKKSESNLHKTLVENIISFFSPYRLLDLLENFIFYNVDGNKVVNKIIARQNQYHGMAAIRFRLMCQFFSDIYTLKGEYQKYVAKHLHKYDASCMINHAPGSGKSIVITLLIKWALNNINKIKLLAIFDRNDLEEQFTQMQGKSEIIKNTDMSLESDLYNCTNGQDLKISLADNSRKVIITTLQKFNHAAPQAFEDANSEEEQTQGMTQALEQISAQVKQNLTKCNFLAIVDECHRSHSGKFHSSLKSLLPPDSHFLVGLSGTIDPNIYENVTNKKTVVLSEANFGDVVHTYSYLQSEREGNIFDITYVRPQIEEATSSFEQLSAEKKQEIKDIIEEQGYSQSQIARAINSKLSHFEPTQVVPFIAQYVEKYLRARNPEDKEWGGLLVTENIDQAFVYAQLLEHYNQQVSLEQQIPFALITSFSLNKGANFESAKSENYTQHVRYMQQLIGEEQKTINESEIGDSAKRAYEEKMVRLFKQDPKQLRLLILVDKLTTGFDAPKARLIMLARNLKDKKLIQTISRVNRFAPDKQAAYLVDFADNFENIHKAIHDYVIVPDQYANSNPEASYKQIRLEQLRKDLLGYYDKVKHFCETYQITGISSSQNSGFAQVTCSWHEFNLHLHQHKNNLQFLKDAKSFRNNLKKIVSLLVICASIEPQSFSEQDKQALNFALQLINHLEKSISLPVESHETSLRDLIEFIELKLNNQLLDKMLGIEESVLENSLDQIVDQLIAQKSNISQPESQDLTRYATLEEIIATSLQKFQEKIQRELGLMVSINELKEAFVELEKIDFNHPELAQEISSKYQNYLANYLSCFKKLHDTRDLEKHCQHLSKSFANSQDLSKEENLALKETLEVVHQKIIALFTKHRLL
ncbi:type I restriction enzyme subunit R domain-containing protein [Psittacicella gerlachiana]|uniref:type I site-specific deoxyribonuclease n=1 Tax=Psittacicella gerlachiana TaxID=2028574 RepID=A0A3A1YL99_9GAMM|nr:DEAD/DEAH box helicase family protein [Psittacicella gerlachiana]RIY36787.1 hypothetical protein CKF59_02280 [Psittacicella gerlachiana]